MTGTAIDSSDITKVGIGATVAVVVIGFLLGLIITAIVARVIIVVVVVGLGIFIWQQRAVIEDHVKKCQLDMTFFGFHIDAPQGVKDACRAHSSSG
jgi:hypothetical protein